MDHFKAFGPAQYHNKGGLQKENTIVIGLELLFCACLYTGLDECFLFPNGLLFGVSPGKPSSASCWLLIDIK